MEGTAALREELASCFRSSSCGPTPCLALSAGPRRAHRLHARYLDVELSAAFGETTRGEGRYKNFYTGVEPVGDGRYDLLLVTLDKGDQKHEHLQYADFPLSETVFHWQSQSRTRADSEDGLRHLQPADRGVTPLLFVREAKKDARGVTNAFRFLGPGPAALAPRRAAHHHRVGALDAARRGVGAPLAERDLNRGQVRPPGTPHARPKGAADCRASCARIA